MSTTSGLAALLALTMSGSVLAQTAEPSLTDFSDVHGAKQDYKDEDYKQAVKTHFESIARDPTSIIYEWGPEPVAGWTAIAFAPRFDGLVGCVYVNMKNGYGGYAGRRSYTYVVRGGRVMQAFHGRVKVGKFISHSPGCDW